MLSSYQVLILQKEPAIDFYVLLAYYCYCAVKYTGPSSYAGAFCLAARVNIKKISCSIVP